MSEDLVNNQPILGVLLEYLIDERSGLGGQLTGVIVFGVHDLLHGLGATDVVEGGLAAEHLVGQYSDAPDVHAVVVAFPVHYLG